MYLTNALVVDSSLTMISRRLSTLSHTLDLRVQACANLNARITQLLNSSKFEGADQSSDCLLFLLAVQLSAETPQRDWPSVRFIAELYCMTFIRPVQMNSSPFLPSLWKLLLTGGGEHLVSSVFLLLSTAPAPVVILLLTTLTEARTQVLHEQKAKKGAVVSVCDRVYTHFLLALSEPKRLADVFAGMSLTCTLGLRYQVLMNCRRIRGRSFCIRRTLRIRTNGGTSFL